MSAQIRAGAYVQSVTLDTPTRTADGDGGYTESWTALAESPWWCEIVPATAQMIERKQAATIEAQISHIVEGRFHSGVTTKTRITFGTRTLFVRGVQNVEEADEVTRLSCAEVTS